MKKVKPRLFIASSSNDLLVASALTDLLADDAEVMAWTEDVFTLASNVLHSMQRVLGSADCALFLTGKGTGGPNRNLFVEIGIAVGTLGIERTAILFDSRATFDVPSDLSGVVLYRYTGADALGRLPAALATVAASLRRWIRKLGRRPDRSAERAEPGQVIPEARKRRQRSRGFRKDGSRRGRTRDSVFISYSHADAKWLAKIRTMLTPLIRADRIKVWDDTRMKAGARWRSEIDRAIASARVALLLVSPTFLASPFIADKELPPILDAAETEGLVVVWALLSACLYKNTPIAAYQAAHAISKPLDSLSVPKRNQALLAIAETVGAAFEDTRHRV